MSDQTPVDQVVAIRRTLAPQVIAGLVLLLGEWGIDMDWLTDRPATLILAYFVLSAAIYGLALLAGKRAPWVEKLLLTTSERPTYSQAPEVTDLAA